MSRPYLVRSFQADKKAICRRAFKANGRQFHPGDVFDWRRLSITPRKAKLLFDGGLIGHEDGVFIPERETIKPEAETPVEVEIKGSIYVGEEVKAEEPEKKLVIDGEEIPLDENGNPDVRNIRDREILWKISDHFGVPRRRSKEEIFAELEPLWADD